MGAFPPAQGDESEETCRVCGTRVFIHSFPALLRRRPEEAEASGGEGAIESDEGGRCFVHPAAVAAAVCEGCGRFMCRDCDTLWQSENLCLTCIHDRREVKREEGFVNRRVIYDNTALGILSVPILFAYPLFILGIFTGPMALYFLIRHRDAPRGFVPRGRFRVVLAWILSITTIVGWLGMIGLVAYAVFEGLTTIGPQESE